MTLGRHPFYLLVILGTIPTAPFPVLAQEARFDKVRFSTADGVELHGSFYPSAKKNAPVVIMLHALGVGQDSKKKEWLSLAEELQKSGLAVLAFDFRGHGQSTEVTPELFWSVPINAALVKTTVKSSIEFKNFDKRYYPVLINDIAAARAYLERTKNDSGACSTSSIIVIGAETGATLGAAWTTSEWYRYKFTPPSTIDTRAEGKDIIGGIWLSISPQLGSRTVRITQLLDIPCRIGATATVFMYSDGDTKGKEIGKACEKVFKVAKSEKHRYIAAVELKKNKLMGAALLQKSLGSEKAIVDYLEGVVEDKSNEWGEREFRKNQYVWRFPATTMLPQIILPAKTAGEMMLNFDTYERYFP